MKKNKLLGRRGEEVAREYLKSQGYKILANNYRVGRYELDIITAYKKRTVFFEVKTRSWTALDYRNNQLSKTKFQRLQRALLSYASLHHLSLNAISLDLISISFNSKSGRATLRHYRSII